MITEKDKEYMQIALTEAKKALEKGNYPVGAVITIDDEFIAKGSNSLHSGKNWASHAESTLIINNSNLIKEKINNGSKVKLYTTLEPCLMCLGTAILHRITKIIYACPDPHGGATGIKPENLTEWYVQKWPVIEKNVFKEEAYELMTTFMKNKNTDTWNKILKLFENMNEK